MNVRCHFWSRVKKRPPSRKKSAKKGRKSAVVEVAEAPVEVKEQLRGMKISARCNVGRGCEDAARAMIAGIENIVV